MQRAQAPRLFPRFAGDTYLTTSRCDWFIALSARVVIDLSDP